MTENTVNVANINRMIEAISREVAPIYMNDFVMKHADCGTQACLAGWANILRLGDEAKTLARSAWQFADTDAAGAWMGINSDQGNRLFFHGRADLLPHDERKAATIALLTKLRDTGDAQWRDVLPRELYSH